MFDLIVRGGHVIDPSQNLDGVRDVGVIGSRIAEIGPDIVRGASAARSSTPADCW